MKAEKRRILLIVTVVLSVTLATLGQNSDDNSARIRALRAEIKSRETASVPADMVELNRRKLLERRAELRTLLGVEIDHLKKYARDMGINLTPEEKRKVDDSIVSYQSEMRALATAMQSDLALETAGDESPGSGTVRATEARSGDGDGGAGPSVAASAQPSPNVTAGLSNTDTAPTTIQTPSATPTLVTKAIASEEGQKSSAPLDCNDVRKEGASSKKYSEMDKLICSLPGTITSTRTQNNLPENRILMTGDQAFFDLIKIIIARKDTPGYLVDAEETRLDKQVSGPAANPASGSLTTKGGAPAILGFAVENGGLERSINGSQITFRGNPVGLVDALKNIGFVTALKKNEQDPLRQFLSKTSFAFTFNTDRGPQPGVFTATKQQLSSVSARIELINKRRAEFYEKDWEDFLKNRLQPIADVLNANTGILTDSAVDPRNFPFGQWRDPALQAWFAATQQAIANKSEGDLDTIIQDRISKLPIKELSAETVAALDRISKELGLYSSGRDDLLKKINSGTLVTFEYLNKREVNAPNTSHFTFIAEKGSNKGGIDFTLNASFTIFDNMNALRNFVKLNPTLPQPRRFRDFQFSGQFDVPLGNVRDFGQLVLFGAGRYERLLENASTDLGTVLPNTKGDIASAQFGIKIPIKGTGFKIPFSVTFANRTELVKEKTVRGNIGFTLDLDTIISKFKPF
jgi:hypothetical protein